MTSAAPAGVSASPPLLLSSITTAGLCAAAVDAAYFTIKAVADGSHLASPLQGIASFWLGPAASSGGLAIVALGAATHVGLATLMAAGFVVLEPHVRALRGSTIQAGAIYGVSLYMIMYLIVLPLRWPQIFPSFTGWASVFDGLVHIAVGVTIVFVARMTTLWLTRRGDLPERKR